MTARNPEIAKKLHMFGNGRKVLLNDECWWINPDLTQAERRANFNARQHKRMRLKSNKNVNLHL